MHIIDAASGEADGFRQTQDSSIGAGVTADIPAKRHIAFTLPGLGAGGAERVVSILANSLVKKGWRVSVIAFAEPETASYYNYKPKVEIVRLGLPPETLPWFAGTFQMITRVRRMRQALRQIAPDTVLSFLTRTNVMVLIATIGMKIPVVVSERNNPKSQTFGPIWSLLRAAFYPRAFGLVTITRGAMDIFPKWMRRRAWIIPNPVVLARTPVTALRSDNKVVTAVGRLVSQKGFDMLLRAFAQIADIHPEWNLVIWGEGPERAALERDIARLGIEGRVQLPGVSLIPGSWAGGADMFVLSSRYEGWGNALLEALAAGIATVTFDCPWGPREMIEEEVNGLLVAPEDVPALAAALDRLMGDAELRQRLGSAARRSAKRFSSAPIVAEWEAIVEAAIASRKPAFASPARTQRTTTPGSQSGT